MTKIILITIVSFLISGCSTSAVVDRRLDENTVVVKTNKNEFRLGEKVVFLKQTCREYTVGKNAIERKICNKYFVGEGEVARLFSKDEAIVSAKASLPLEKGILVQKQGEAL